MGQAMDAPQRQAVIDRMRAQKVEIDRLRARVVELEVAGAALLTAWDAGGTEAVQATAQAIDHMRRLIR